MKTLMTRELVEKRLKKAALDANKRLSEYGSAKRVSIRNAASVPFKVRSGVFGTSNLSFEPSTGHATSYRWYIIAKVFKGKLVLNTYSYSSTTSKHVCKLRSLFRQLGLSYVSVNAPRGLQDEKTAKRHELYQLAKRELEAKHSRDGKKKFKPYTLAQVKSVLSVIALMGEKISLAEWKAAQVDALESRTSILAKLKEKRLARKAAQVVATAQVQS